MSRTARSYWGSWSRSKGCSRWSLVSKDCNSSHFSTSISASEKTSNSLRWLLIALATQHPLAADESATPGNTRFKRLESIWSSVYRYNCNSTSVIFIHRHIRTESRLMDYSAPLSEMCYLVMGTPKESLPISLTGRPILPKATQLRVFLLPSRPRTRGLLQRQSGIGLVLAHLGE